MAGEGEKETYTKEELQAAIAANEAGLKANQAELLKDVKATKAKLAAYDGFDPAEYKTLKQQAAEAEQKKAADAGNWDALKKQLLDNHSVEKTALEKRIAKYDAAVNKRSVEAALIAEITAAEGNAKMLLPYAKQFVRVRETDDDFEAYVTDEKGNPMIGDAQGAPMTIKQFVQATLRTEFPGAFKGTGSSGSGASKSTVRDGGNGKTVAAQDDRGFLANVEKIATKEVTMTLDPAA